MTSENPGSKKRSHVVAVVQARMRSTRLPAKVLRPIAGWPLLKHVIHRLRQAKTVDKIVIATTTAPEDDALAEWVMREGDGAHVIRGPEDDVLGRFALAVAAHDPDIIVRVNADAPLIEGAFIDHLVRVMRAEDADFVMALPGEPCIHDGVDPVSRRGFDLLMREAREDPVAREHVTAWFKEHQDRVKVAYIRIPEPYRFAGARLSVDAPADVAFIEAIYARLHAQAGEASLADLVALLKRDPSLLEINQHIRQKSTHADSGTIVIRCDGSPALGYGHVTRSLMLAGALRDRCGFGVLFAVTADAECERRIADHGFPLMTMPKLLDEAAWLTALIAGGNPRALVLDIRTRLSRKDVLRLRRHGLIIATIDDGHERRLAADLCFLPPVPQVRDLSWRGAAGEALIGWEWTLSGAQPVDRPVDHPTFSGSGACNILVTMGGSDPASQTLIAARAVAALGQKARATIIVGPGFADADAVIASLRALDPQPCVVHAPPSLAPFIAQSDLAIAAFGVTAFELAASGVPALLVALTRDHAQSASALDASGIAELVGMAGVVTSAMLTERLVALAGDKQRRHAMSAAGRIAFDGRSAARIAERIAARISACDVAKTA